MIVLDFSWGCIKEMALQQRSEQPNFCLATVSIPAVLSHFPAPLANSSGVFASHFKCWGREVPGRPETRLAPRVGRGGALQRCETPAWQEGSAHLPSKPARPSQLAPTCPPRPGYTHFWGKKQNLSGYRARKGVLE